MRYERFCEHIELKYGSKIKLTTTKRDGFDYFVFEDGSVGRQRVR